MVGPDLPLGKEPKADCRARMEQGCSLGLIATLLCSLSQTAAHMGALMSRHKLIIAQTHNQSAHSVSAPDIYPIHLSYTTSFPQTGPLFVLIVPNVLVCSTGLLCGLMMRGFCFEMVIAVQEWVWLQLWAKLLPLSAKTILWSGCWSFYPCGPSCYGCQHSGSSSEHQ